VPLARRWLFRSEALSPAFFNIPGQLPHRLLRDDAAFAAGKGRFRLIDSGKDFGAGTLTFFPERKGLFYRIFLCAKAAALDCLADERFLAGGEVYFHCLSVGTLSGGVKWNKTADRLGGMTSALHTGSRRARPRNRTGLAEKSGDSEAADPHPVLYGAGGSRPLGFF